VGQFDEASHGGEQKSPGRPCTVTFISVDWQPVCGSPYGVGLALIGAVKCIVTLSTAEAATIARPKAASLSCILTEEVVEGGWRRRRCAHRP